MTDRPEPEERRFDWVNSRVDGHSIRFWILVAVVITSVVLGFGAWWTARSGPTQPAAGAMGDMTATGEDPVPPPATGYYQGEVILFIHTEASDSGVADMLTTMMGSPVLVVPQLSQVPDAALAEVYVFTNGIQPDGPAGPFGYQPDIFDAGPGDPAYSPFDVSTWSTGNPTPPPDSSDPATNSKQPGRSGRSPSPTQRR